MTQLVPILLPELGSGNAEVRVSLWFVASGEHVDAGDQLLEVQLPGITFDVCSPATGTVTKIEKPLSAVVAAGDVLGWLST